jgi:hypothetical protein
MDFENESLENEDERELQDGEDNANEIVELPSDGAEELETSFDLAVEGDAADEVSSSEPTAIVEPSESSITPAPQTVEMEQAGELELDPSRAKFVSVDSAAHSTGSGELLNAGDAGERVTRITVTDVDRERREGLSDWALSMIQAGPRGEQGIARAVAYVQLPDYLVQQAIKDALADVSQRDAMVCKDIAHAEVRREFWVRDCQERAIIGNR